MSTPVQRLLAALSEPDAQKVRALGADLAEHVRAAGPFVNGAGRAAVLSAISEQQLPLFKAAQWSEPERADDLTTVRGMLPPGLQISGVVLSLRSAGGEIVELLQEIVMAPPPPATALDLSGAIQAAIDGAFDAGNPMIVAYVDAEGAPHVSYRGTVQVHARTELAMWIRDPNGGLLRGIQTNPKLVLMYRDPKSRAHYEITGRAKRDDTPAVRDLVFERSPAFEQGLDPARRGAAVLIEVDTLVGGPPGQAVNMTRDAG